MGVKKVKIKFKKNSGLALILIIVVLVNVQQYFKYEENNEIIIVNKPKASDYLELNPFIIRDGGIGPKDYTWAEAVLEPWCSGGGTKNNPYVISNIIINGQAQDLCCIYIVSSTAFFNIKDCIFYNSRHVAYGGIKLSHVSNGHILNNKCFNNTVGIRIEDSDNINITNNIINENEYGLMMISTSQVNIISNNASNNHYDCGISVYNGESYNISGNIVNNNHYGLYLGGNSNEILMSNNYAKGNYYGIGIYSTFNSALINNTVLNSYTGIDFMDSDNNIVNSCVVYNSDGSVLDMYESFNNNFSFNKFSHNSWGIKLRYSDGNKFKQNEISSNSYFGIRLSGSNKNELEQNEIILNSDQGIKFISGSQFNNVSGNIISNNGSIGIKIDSSCSNNSFDENFLLKNEKHAIDEGTDNNWNSTIIGNYWDNHTEPDVSPIDGIVDVPYTFIGGSAGSIDYLPIAEDGAPRITINSPEEGDRFNTTAPSFDVEVIDDYVCEMWYTIDGGLHNYTFTENGTISQVAWDTLPEGRVTITFYASDIVGNEAFEEVTVIKGISARGLDPGVMIFITIISAAGVIGITAITIGVLRKRKLTNQDI